MLLLPRNICIAALLLVWPLTEADPSPTTISPERAPRDRPRPHVSPRTVVQSHSERVHYHHPAEVLLTTQEPPRLSNVLLPKIAQSTTESSSSPPLEGCPTTPPPLPLPQRLEQALAQVEESSKTLRSAQAWTAKAIREIVDNSLPHLVSQASDLSALALRTEKTRHQLLTVQAQLDHHAATQEDLRQCEDKIAHIREAFSRVHQRSRDRRSAEPEEKTPDFRKINK